MDLNGTYIHFFVWSLVDFWNIHGWRCHLKIFLPNMIQSDLYSSALINGELVAQVIFIQISGYDFALIPLRSFQFYGWSGGWRGVNRLNMKSIMSKTFEKTHTHMGIHNVQDEPWHWHLLCNTGNATHRKKKAISKEQQRRTVLIRKNSSVVPDYLHAGPRFSAGFWTFWHGVANKMKILLDTQLV